MEVNDTTYFERATGKAGNGKRDGNGKRERETGNGNGKRNRKQTNFRPTYTACTYMYVPDSVHRAIERGTRATKSIVMESVAVDSDSDSSIEVTILKYPRLRAAE